MLSRREVAAFVSVDGPDTLLFVIARLFLASSASFEGEPSSRFPRGDMLLSPSVSATVSHVFESREKRWPASQSWRLVDALSRKAESGDQMRAALRV